MTHRCSARGSNPLPPAAMTPQERRAELCRLLALGLIRLRMRTDAVDIAAGGDVPLHSPPDRSGHATPTQRRPA
ncbi:hypothetical protein DR046_02765 [Jannaschia formosa]|nr:hypothetical protein DR046_02765 [Jannaschia formosa]